MDETLSQLEAQYCPPLDPALLSAILSDYNLEDSKELGDAKALLDGLKDAAILEEQAGFDPSGTGGQEESGVVEQQPETTGSQSRATDFTSISDGLASVDLSEGSGAQDVYDQHADEIEGLDQDTKVQLLQDMFGDHVSRYSIEHTLKKCGGRWSAAMEELLNHVYFGDATNSPDGTDFNVKGVDGFMSEDSTGRRGRKGKAKNKRLKHIEDRRSSSLSALNADPPPPPSANKWKFASEDIDFVATRTGVKNATVASIYYDKGASISKTIGALLKASMEESKHVVTDEVAVLTEARELGRDYPNIAPDYLTALIRLTHPSTTSAHELAKALTTKPTDSTNGVLRIIPQYAPLNTLDNDSNWTPTPTKPRSTTSSRSPSPSSGISASTRRDAYALARAAAFTQASAAHRRAKSERLMGGAAAYYGQVGREYAALSSKASASAADQLVASQSSATQLDLHGVDVLNAVRIAHEKVERWWDGLGESRINGRVGAGERQMGYRIIVGLGRHSEGGRSKLGPAVTKALKQGGWKVEHTGAVIVVKGPAR